MTRRQGRDWIRASVLIALVAGMVSPASATILVDLEWRQQEWNLGLGQWDVVTGKDWLVGETVTIGLYTVCDTPGETLDWTQVTPIFTWDTLYLDFLGLNHNGELPNLDPTQSKLPYPDTYYGINEADPPKDGDGRYNGQTGWGQTITATSEGTLVTTFEFEALAVTPPAGTDVNILDSLQLPGCLKYTTRVKDADNRTVTGDLFGTTVTIVPEPQIVLLLVIGGVIMLLGRLRYCQ